MCGFIGIFGPDGVDVAPEIYEGLLAVQHRGQDAAGMITYTDRFNLRKSHGLVSEVSTEAMQAISAQFQEFADAPVFMLAERFA